MALHDMAKMTVTGTPGTGTITLNAAVSGFQTFAAAGVTNSEVVSYSISDGTSWEVGRGTYTTSGTTLTRGAIYSSNSNAAIDATSAAIVAIVSLAEDIVPWNSVDAAAPTAITWSAQSVATGTLNTAGADWTFVGSKGTGTGAGGKIIFKITGAGGTSGSSQNTPLNAISIDNYPSFNNPRVTISGSAINAAQLCLGGDVNTGLTKDSGSDIAFFVSSTYAGAIATVGAGNLAAWTLPSTTPFGFASATSVGSLVDTVLTRAAAATLQHGKADAAAPVAQTIQAQSVVAGTSNTSGVDFTIQGSRGTGDHAGGAIVFKTAPAGGSGTGQNAAAEVARILAVGNVKFTNAANFSANGSVATVLGSIGPTGAQTTVQTWLTIVDSTGATRYIPCF